MRIVLVVLLISSTQVLRAEYVATYLKFTIETTSGDHLVGYNQTLMLYQYGDSLQNENFLYSILQSRYCGGTDTLEFYKTLIAYRTNYDGSQEPGVIYDMQEKGYCLLKNIKRVYLTETIDYSYACGIYSKITKKDTWIHQKPVATFSANGYLCSFDFYIHQDIPGLEKLFSNLRLFLEQYDDDGLTREEMEVLDHKMYDLVSDILARKRKIVVVHCCTC